MWDLPAAVWRKSSLSGVNGCVEVAVHEDTVAVRDSKSTAGPVLLFAAAEWERFLAAEHPRRPDSGRGGRGTMEALRPRGDAGGRVEVAFRDGNVTLRSSLDRRGPVLAFTPREWRAFLGGVGNGEFDLARLAGPVERAT